MPEINREIEELEEALSDALTEEEKIRALNTLAFHLREKEPQRALDLASEALALIGNREDLPKEQADAFFVKGFADWRLSNYPNALSTIQSALAL